MTDRDEWPRDPAYFDEWPLPPAVFDPQRLRNLIEIGLANHPDRERVTRFLRAGANIEPSETTTRTPSQSC